MNMSYDFNQTIVDLPLKSKSNDGYRRNKSNDNK